MKAQKRSGADWREWGRFGNNRYKIRNVSQLVIDGWRRGRMARWPKCCRRMMSVAQGRSCWGERGWGSDSYCVKKTKVWTRGMSVDGLAGKQTADSEGTRGSLLVWLPVCQHFSLNRSAIPTDFSSLKDFGEKTVMAEKKLPTMRNKACAWPPRWRSTTQSSQLFLSHFQGIWGERL